VTATADPGWADGAGAPRLWPQHGVGPASGRRGALTDKAETRRSAPVAGEAADGKGEP